MAEPNRNTQGPFLASQLREGDRYELSSGHAVYCAPAGRDHAASNLQGGNVLATDPSVEWAGVDAGFSPKPGDLRAPDIAIGAPATEESGWINGVPQLAVEYAGIGQDEGDLARKIDDLLSAGTRYVWVVRLVGPQRVDVHEEGKAPRTFSLGDQLEAPGILKNPVPVRALYDRGAGFDAMLRNLLQREGYDDLEAVLKEGREEGREEGHIIGRREGLLAVIRVRGLTLDARQRALIDACRDSALLESWLSRAEQAPNVAEIFA